ncbi:hypothetical protein KIH41_15950 [Litoribacter ruber]|uniref:Uncharacterized protein n=1 Tax=Litoribacter ruber TaxID=702568 RepID=A0AAP2G5Y2_9BACT|nr:MULTISPECIES: hypothetical protein [Litoribacter]MBS9525531.1 hypothetical protein [Litoribacter alkaliphilus]MBT0812780.1 hypothetical protein [Litoribacter ruber]
MAKQTSMVTFTGTIGGVTFYNTSEGPRARQKGGVTKSRIMNDPKYERTRENMQEFGTASHMALLLKHAVRDSLIRVPDSTFHSRFISILSEAVKNDPVSDRGSRVLTPENLAILKGFRANKARSLKSTLNCYYEVSKTDRAVQFTFEELQPQEFRGPSNATHFRLFAEAAAVELEAEEADGVRTESDYLPMELNPGDLSFTLEFEGETFPHKVCMLGIEFFKFVAGKPYPVAKKKYNTAEFV